jgi:Flp pilus assembly protein TadD
VQAVAVLEEAVEDKPTVALLSMLGKTYMKAGEWNLAVANLNKAIQLTVR